MLFLSWRDPDHPQSGGAETYLIEVARRFALMGMQVTIFASRPRGTAPQAMVDGVRVIRHGGRLSTYAHAALLMLRAGDLFDVVVDVQNGIPFFSPLFSFGRTPIVGLIHHVHQDQFRQHFRWPIHHFGRVLEGPVARWVYGRRPIVVVSPSTRQEVRRRLRLRGPLHVAPNGLDVAETRGRLRSTDPAVVVVSRLSAHKRVDLVLEAAVTLRTEWPTLRIDIVGDGPDLPALEARTAELGLGGMVFFHGFVDEQRKLELMARAWVAVSASEQEGWGLNVLEANAVGVPTVGRNVPGLRDSIRDGVTGWLVDNRPLGAGIGDALRAVESAASALEWAGRCRTWAAAFSWDRTSDILAGVLVAEIGRSRSGHAKRERRARSDVSVIVGAGRYGGGDQDVERALRGMLRATDRWTRYGATDIRIHLHGCDEHDAQAVLRRLSMAGDSTARTASSADLLVNAEADPSTGDAFIKAS